MKSAIVNRKSLVVILVVVLIGVGAQGINHGQAADEYPPTSRIALLEDGISILFVPQSGRGTAYSAQNRSTVSLDLVRNSKWQRRDDSTSPWVDVPDSERTTGLYGYVITLLGEYRWVGELNINGVWGKYSSRNMLRLTQDGTVTSIPAEVEGFPSDRHKLTLEGHTEGVLSVAFSPDGSTLVSGGNDFTIQIYDDTIRLWDANTGEPLQTLKGHKSGVTSLAFSLDGSSTLASGSWDRTVQVWVLAPAMPAGEPFQLEGDLNADGVVNVQDLVLVASQFGKAGQNMADINEDGVVNIQDLVLVAGAFSVTISAPAAHPQ